MAKQKSQKKKGVPKRAIARAAKNRGAERVRRKRTKTGFVPVDSTFAFSAQVRRYRAKMDVHTVHLRPGEKWEPVMKYSDGFTGIRITNPETGKVRYMAVDLRRS